MPLGIENANGRLRRWLPRQLDIDRTSDQEIQEIVLTTNLIPRKCLGFKTPCLDVYGPRPIAIDFSELRFKVTTADVYPASLRGLIDHRREPRWIFARFHLNGARALAEAMPVQTPGSGSDGGDPFRHLPPFDCNCR